MEKIKISKTSIMFTDIVGYSSMVNKDERHALELLQIHDDIIEPIIKDNHGTIIKKIGDAIFAEFADSNSCCKTAVAAQKQLIKRNSLSNQNDQINIRIGLHAGKVIRKDNDLFGHDVNLCSRIESTATSGSISASFEFINSLNDLFMSREIGYVKLKNILNPQQLYKIYLSKRDFENENAKQLYNKSIDSGLNIVDIQTYTSDNSYEIGLLYVNNLGDKDDETISYNITEELINDLGYINEIRTPSFNKILGYKDTKLGNDDIARKLEVDYILSSNLLKEGNNIKFSCELLNINTGSVLWSCSFNESLANLKSIRESITKSILKEFKIDYPKKLVQLYSKKISNNDTAIELYYKSKYCYNYLQTNDDLTKGIDFAKESILLDKNLIESRTIYGMLLHQSGNFDLAESNLLEAQEIAEQSRYLQGLSDIYKSLQVIYSDKGQYDKALLYIKKSLKIQVQLDNNLFEAMIRIDYANLLNHIGKLKESIEQNKKAISLLQSMDEDRLVGISNAVLFNTYFAAVEYKQAIKYGIKALRIFRKLEMKNFESRVLVIMAEAYSQIGQYDEMDIYINDAKPIVNEFNDLFLLGKISYFKSEHYLKNKEINLAKDYIDKSIEYYDLVDNQVYKVDMMVEKIKLLIEEDSFESSRKYLNKIHIQARKIKGQYDETLLKTIDMFLCYNENVDEKDVKNLISKDISKNIFIYWYIARIFFNKKLTKLSNKYHIFSKELIKKNGAKLKKEDLESYNSTYFNFKILDDIKGDMKEKDRGVFEFCPGCGFKNSDNFLFCPKCGNKLES